MMATSHTFPSEESLPHPQPNFQTQQINTKQAVIYNKSGTKCMNIVKDPSGVPLSPTSPSTKDQNDISPSHSPQNNNGTTKRKKKKKSKRKPPVDHVEEPDVNGSHNNHTKANYNSENEEEAVDVEIEEDDEFFSDEEGYDPEAPEIPFPRKDSIVNHDDDNHVPTTPSKKKKKKKKNKNGLSMNQISDIHHNHSHHSHNHKSRKDGIWNTNNSEERQRIREFWLQLGEEERRSLVKVEKEAVLKKMKEQQKHSCSCSVCGKKRTAIEAELETLYDAYYEELESYANHQQQFSPSNIEYRNDAEYDEDDEEEEYEDEEEEEDDDYEGSEHDSDTRKEFFNFGNSLTVKGGILTVADDLLKNDGKKFLEMMERLAERRMQREEEEASIDREYYEEEEEEDDDEYEDGEEDNQTEEQRMEDGRRMFQIFAAKMFEQRVLNAYREKVAQERQQKLLEELEEENRIKEEREQKRLKEKEKKKAKNRALKQQKEEERARREAERLAEEKALRAEREKKLEEERKRREEERLKKEAEKRAKEEERQKKEEEKRRKAKEEKEKEERKKKEQERKEKEERERKEREEKARREDERRQREERERKQRELIKEKERKEREEQERKERERKEREAKERERKEKEEQERKDREEKERKEREEKQRAANVPPLRQPQHHERKRTIPPIGQPSAQPPPPISTPVIQNKPVVSIPNGMNWMNYSSHEQHQSLPQHSINPHVINSHLPPPPNHPNHPNHPLPHQMFNPGGPQPQFGGQPVGIMNGPAVMTNEVVNEVFTNTKKVINPPPQGTNTQGINPTSSLFATGLSPIGMAHHGGPPVPLHAHQVMRQQMPPPRGFNPIAPTPHLPGPSGMPPSVASTNLSLISESGVTGNPQANALGGLPICGQGPLGPQTFNLGSQVVNQPASSHMGPSSVVPNTPLAPIGHRRMSQHPEDSHVKAVQRPQPIQRPRRNSSTGQSLEARTRSPPPGFGNMVGLSDDQTRPMANRRQSLAPGESSYFSNSLFSTAMPGEPNPPQPSQNQQQHGTNRLSSHRPVVNDNEWPPIRGRQGVTDNLLRESVSISGNSSNSGNNNIGTTDIWGSNYAGGQSLWYSEGNNSTNRRAMGSRDFGIP